jgi:hypothetical protein
VNDHGHRLEPTTSVPMNTDIDEAKAIYERLLSEATSNGLNQNIQ